MGRTQSGTARRYCEEDTGMSIQLKPIREISAEYDPIEKKIKKLFLESIYLPIMENLRIQGIEKQRLVKNAAVDPMTTLCDAIVYGRITYDGSQFKGRFNSTLSRELSRIGAKWDRKQGSFRIPQSQLPMEVLNAISLSHTKFMQTLDSIDSKLAKIVPEEIAERLKITNLFDDTLWRVEKDFQKSVKGIRVAPQLTPERRAKIAQEYSENMKLSIKGWMDSEIKELRAKVIDSTFEGNRYETLFGHIQKSYGVSERKAKFLARQETNLLLTTYKEARYVESGIDDYYWKCVRGSPLHPVRPGHQKLNDLSEKGKTFRFSDPPIDSGPGEPTTRNNPGRNFNCRCVAIPVVKF